MTGYTMRIFIDSFSGNAAQIKKKDRTVEALVAVLKENPRISTWDLSENPWLRSIVSDAKKQGLISEVDEPYPWHRFVVNAV
jgi:hypothetical protein